MAAEPLHLPGQEIRFDDSDPAVWVWGQFSVLYREHFDRLRRYCLGLTGNESLAEDVAQETLLRAYERMTTFDFNRPPWPWLKLVARRMIVDHARRAKIEAARAATVDEPVADDASIAVERDALARALAALPARQRVALALRYIDDWDCSDVARAMAITRPALDQLLFRARRRFTSEYRRMSDELRVALWPVLLAGAWLRQRANRFRAFVTEGGGMPLTATTQGVSQVVAAVAIGTVLVAGGVAAAAPRGTHDQSTTVTAAGAAIRETSVPRGAARASAPTAPVADIVSEVVEKSAGTSTPSQRAVTASPSAPAPRSGATRSREVTIAPETPSLVTVAESPAEPKGRAGTKRDETTLRVEFDGAVTVDSLAPQAGAGMGAQCTAGSVAIRTSCESYDDVDASVSEAEGEGVALGNGQPDPTANHDE